MASSHTDLPRQLALWFGVPVTVLLLFVHSPLALAIGKELGADGRLYMAGAYGLLSLSWLGFLLVSWKSNARPSFTMVLLYCIVVLIPLIFAGLDLLYAKRLQG
jgi:hypothetical protein